MVNVFDVARYILTSIGGEVLTSKLQRLCYYAQAWHLAKHGVPLFREDFERRISGPRCPKLFNVNSGRFYVNKDNIRDQWCLEEEFTKNELGAIEFVLQRYGPLEGHELRSIACSEDPWKNTAENDIILKEVMRDFYFAQWGDDDSVDDTITVTREEIEREIESAKESPIYDSADEMFKATLGSEALGK
jgi:uncharacterized phage-associated protein